MSWKPYRKKAVVTVEMIPWSVEMDMTDVSVSKADSDAGSPKAGDMIARKADNHKDMWLVNAAFFAENYDTTPVN